MVVAAFLAGLVLVLSRTEGSLAATSRGALQATSAAEYGIELSVNGLNPAQASTGVFSATTLAPGVSVTPGLRNGTNNTPQNLGVTACPPGYSLSLGCTAYLFDATGWARGWLSTTASVQIEKSEAIYRGCSGTEYSC
jgi:hypothetical protein